MKRSVCWGSSWKAPSLSGASQQLELGSMISDVVWEQLADAAKRPTVDASRSWRVPRAALVGVCGRGLSLCLGSGSSTQVGRGETESGPCHFVLTCPFATLTCSGASAGHQKAAEGKGARGARAFAGLDAATTQLS